MDLGLNGKIALVTAASRGLGRGCAEQLAAEKCRVAICSRDEAAAKQAAEEIVSQTGAEVVGFGADVSKVEDIRRLLIPFLVEITAGQQIIRGIRPWIFRKIQDELFEVVRCQSKQSILKCSFPKCIQLLCILSSRRDLNEN